MIVWGAFGDRFDHVMASVDALFRDIHMLILRSLHSVQQVMINDKHCFELYGLDLALDSDGRTWLLEVNSGPDLALHGARLAADADTLVRDTLGVVGKHLYRGSAAGGDRRGARG